MIKKVEVQVFEDRLYCDKCGEKMNHTGVVLCSYPPKYPYECPSYGWSTTSTTRYPNVVYKTVDK